MKNNESFEETFLFNFFKGRQVYVCVNIYIYIYMYKHIFSKYKSLIYILYHIFKRVNSFFCHTFLTCHMTVT